MNGEERQRKEMMELFWRMIEEAVERSELYPDRLTVIALSDALKANLFTPRRLQLIEALQAKPATSISELADRLGRPIASVSRDIRILNAYGLVELRQEGRSKVPVLVPTHIVITLSQAPSRATTISTSA